MAEARIQKVLADAGVASRRAAEQLVAAGRVSVNGASARIGQRVDPLVDAVLVDGRPLPTAMPRVHIVLDKPVGVTSTVRDRHAAMTVLELIDPAVRARAGRLYPVGRLDRDSEGLLLLTNDGPWAQRVLHPSHALEREYAVGLPRPLDSRQARGLLDGVDLEEGLGRLVALRPATQVEIRTMAGLVDEPPAGLSWYRVTIAQGWRRQLRRMFAAVGAPVRRLVRVRFGPLRLAGLRPGEARPLTAAEVRRLSSSR